MNSLKLIALYCYICDLYDNELQWYCQRMSPNDSPKFTDAECLTIYLYAVIEEEKYQVKSIHRYAKSYLMSWFPDLPSYQAFNHRLNFLSELFSHICQHLLNEVSREGVDFHRSLLDSMPIMSCSGKRAGKVAPELTDKGYCATKKMHYYGVKLHAVGFRRAGALPLPEYLLITPASTNDLSALRMEIGQLTDREIFADKAYSDTGLNQELEQHNRSYIFTPVKLIKGQSQWERQFNKAGDELFSTAVSKVRQPIESLFNWVIEKVKIQQASKVRSAKGLILHIFGKLAAAFTIWAF